MIRSFTIIIPPGLLNFGIFGSLKSGIVGRLESGIGIIIGILGNDESGELKSGSSISGILTFGILTSGI